MEERLKVVARLPDGEKMAALCRELDISRKAGYKILARYNDTGLEGCSTLRAQDFRNRKGLGQHRQHRRDNWIT
ncbi:helix-turn-helix domain-containing protein [Mesorhizobium sp. BR1-1-9]|uniref:helix-turn-helix domain-containing protein n=1 Tax=Mesorhizobium sp. BR1-1-9 TaxID=2876646 RepID=UPI00398D13AD